MYDDRFRQLTTSKNLIIVLPWHRTSSSEFKTEFERSAEIYFGLKDKGNNLNWKTAMSYDATQALAEGLRQASSNACAIQTLVPSIFNDCLRKNLLMALKGELNQPNGFSAMSAVGKNGVRFDENGDRKSAKVDGVEGIGVFVEICSKVDGEGLNFRHVEECSS
ncbi:MAG: hypothetical protein HC781_09665 [Leptolyngbyaceae cyanobacterium CSU_1_4]|nr:hypothetical protein [Leptolyngbyaceae cyanobacterium CSU_1_4]